MNPEERAEYRPENQARDVNPTNTNWDADKINETIDTEKTTMNDNTTIGQQTAYNQTQDQAYGQTQSQSYSQAYNQTYHQSTTASNPVTHTLYRNPTDKLLGGVCGGLANYFGWDAALVRIIWLVATIVTGGGGLLAYLVLWGMLPVGTVQTGAQRPAAFAINERNIGRMAMVLIGLGGLWLLGNLGILPGILRVFWWTTSIFFWPALLIGIGYLLLRGSGNTNLKVDLNNLKSRFQGRTSGVKMPSSDNLKNSLNQVRDRFPLRRSTSDHLFLGVCGGIGKQVGIDANLVRLLWAAFSVMSMGMGVFLYVAMGLLLPEEKLITSTSYDHVQNVEVVEGTSPRVV